MIEHKLPGLKLAGETEAWLQKQVKILMDNDKNFKRLIWKIKGLMFLQIIGILEQIFFDFY
jgi:hypothetical protein